MGEVEESSSNPVTPRPRAVAPTLTPPQVPPPPANTTNSTKDQKVFQLADPYDAWLPITASRKGNACFAVFHLLASGLGIQATLLPVAFSFLGWTWGIIIFTLMFIWQFYTIYLLVHLHESNETGTRYSRYFQLADATFGKKLSMLLTAFPLIYLSKGTLAGFIIVGASNTRTFLNTVCADTCNVKALTPVEWNLVFTCAAVVLSMLPNLNSITGVSLIATITGVGYTTILWMVSVTKGRIPRVSYDPLGAPNETEKVFHILNALGLIAFTFRGHNLILEIQGTLPSSERRPSRVPMWKGVKYAYLVIAMCLVPVAIGGYWAYGQKIPAKGGLLSAVLGFHRKDTSQTVRGLVNFFIVINALTSYQIYAMPIFDAAEEIYVRLRKKPCPLWLRVIFRTLIGFGSFFVAVAIPFLGSIGGLLGGISLPITLAYPCFMWLKLKKPKQHGKMWLFNWVLGIIGMLFSGLITASAIYIIINTGFKANFFKPT